MDNKTFIPYAEHVEIIESDSNTLKSNDHKQLQ